MRAWGCQPGGRGRLIACGAWTTLSTRGLRPPSPMTRAPRSPSSPSGSASRPPPCRRACAGSSTGVITGYRALLDPEAVGRPLSAFIEISPLDPRQPDDAPELLESIAAIEACHSVAGDAAYMLFVRVGSPRELEALVTEIRQTASVSTRTTVVLQTFYEHRPMLELPAED